MKNSNKYLIMGLMFISLTLVMVFPTPTQAVAGGGNVDYGGGGGNDYSGGGNSHHDSDWSSSRNNNHSSRNGNNGLTFLIFVAFTGFSFVKKFRETKAQEPVDHHLEYDISEVFTLIQQAWSNNDLQPVQHLYSPDLFKTHQALLQKMANEYQRNFVTEVEVEGVYHLVTYGKNKFNVTIHASLVDYTVDTRSDTLISGSFHKRGTITQTWHFTRQDNTGTLIVTKINS